MDRHIVVAILSSCGAEPTLTRSFPTETCPHTLALFTLVSPLSETFSLRLRESVTQVTVATLQRGHANTATVLYVPVGPSILSTVDDNAVSCWGPPRPSTDTALVHAMYRLVAEPALSAVVVAFYDPQCMPYLNTAMGADLDANWVRACLSHARRSWTPSALGQPPQDCWKLFLRVYPSPATADAPCDGVGRRRSSMMHDSEGADPPTFSSHATS